MSKACDMSRAILSSDLQILPYNVPNFISLTRHGISPPIYCSAFAVHSIQDKSDVHSAVTHGYMYTQLLLRVTCTLSCYSGLHVHSAVTQGYMYTQLLLRVTCTLSCYSGFRSWPYMPIHVH